jgi:fatty acid desaturase
VLGRLPARYRLTIWFAGLIAFAGVGAWLSWTTVVPVMWSTGAVLGVLLGVLGVSSFLRQLEHGHDPRTGQPVRSP